MNRYEIKYQYGAYSGTRVIWADGEQEAIAKMWKLLEKDMQLPMAYKSAEVINVEYNYD
jgi:hypothetical protein